MKFKPSPPLLSIDQIEIGQRISAKMISFRITKKGFVGTFHTDFGCTTAFLGNKSDLDFQKVYEFKNKECYLNYNGSFKIDDLSYPNFQITWL